MIVSDKFLPSLDPGGAMQKVPGVDRAVPDALGKGYLRPKSELRAQLLDFSENIIEEESRTGVPEILVHLVDSRSSFAKALSVSANANFSMGAANVTARMSLSRSFRSDRQSLTLVVNKRVTGARYFVRAPIVRKEALASLASSKASRIHEFLSIFGDSVVRSVTFGALLSLIYTLEFESETEAQRFSASATVNTAGGAGGGAAVNSSIVQSASSRAVNLRVIGARKAPPVFQTYPDGSAQTDSIRKKKGDKADKATSAILKYFDDFDKDARTDELNVPAFIDDPFDLWACDNMHGTQSLLDTTPRQRQVEDGIRLADELTDRMAQFHRMKSLAYKWNAEGSQTAAEDLLKAGEKSLLVIERATADIADFRASELGFSEADLPIVPRGWYLDEQKAIPFKAPKKIAGQKDGVSPYRLAIPLPRASIGRVILIDLKCNFKPPKADADATGKIVFGWSTRNGDQVLEEQEVKRGQNVVRCEEPIRAEYMALTFEALVPHGSLISKIDMKVWA